MRLLPLFFNLEGKRVVVVGAGEMARRKIDELVRCGANVEVIAPDADLEGVTNTRRKYERGDLEGAWLAVAATGDLIVTRVMREEAEERRIWLLAIDDLENTVVTSCAVVRREPLVVAISSTAEAPALVRLMREVIEGILPSDRWMEAARLLRQKWKRERTPHGDRFAELVLMVRGASTPPP